MSTQKQKIISQLKNEILSLAIVPGSILSEATLTERFQLSRTPIRDILKQLSSEGYIDIYPQKGSLVSYIDLESVEQIIYLRTTLEKKILNELCGQITLSGQHDLKVILSDQKKTLEANAPFDEFMTLDDAFHRTLFGLAGRTFVWNMIQQYNVHYMRYRRLHMLKQEKLYDILKEHQELLEALLEGNHLPLEGLIQHHIQSDVDSSFFQDHYSAYIKSIVRVSKP